LGQVQVQKKLVVDLSRRVRQIRNSIKRKQIEIENKHIKIDDCKKRIEDLMSTLEEIESQKLSVEERTKCLEKMMEVYLLYILYKKRRTILKSMIHWNIEKIQKC